MIQRHRSVELRLAKQLKRVLLTVAPFVAISVFAKGAHAQAWLRNRTYQEGIGIRAGDVELHPGIGAEVGYDSNWFVRSHNDGPNVVNAAPLTPRVDAGVLRVTPSFSISSRGPQRLGDAQPSFAFRGTAAASYREFFGVAEVRDQRNVNVHAFFRGDILPGRPFGLGFFVGYQRFIQPAAIPGLNVDFNRSDINAGAEAIVMPGGGNLDLRLGYQFYGALYENSVGAAFTNHTHEISFRNKWQFRPKTSIFSETSVRVINYPFADRAVLVLNDSIPMRSRVGINGLLTPRFSALAAVGYSGTFFKAPEKVSTKQFDSVNLQVEGTFYLTGSSATAGEVGQTVAKSTLTLGFNRDVQVGSAQDFSSRPSYILGGGQNTAIGSFNGLDKFYGRFSYLFASRAIVSLDAFLDVLTYPEVFAAGGGLAAGTEGGFTNFRPGLSLFGEYRLTDSFGINGTVDYTQTISDIALPVGAGQVFDLNWRRFQGFVGVRWFM